MRLRPRARRNDPGPGPEPDPVNVEMTVASDGTMGVYVDGEPLTPPPGEVAWTRASFPVIWDHLAASRDGPVRVVVREADGSMFTGAIAAHPRRGGQDREPEGQENPAASLARSALTVRETAPAAPPALIRPPASVPVIRVASGCGFIAGEDVAVALILGDSGADDTGRASVAIPPDLIPETTAGQVETLLWGRSSGTAVLARTTTPGNAGQPGGLL